MDSIWNIKYWIVRYWNLLNTIIADNFCGNMYSNKYVHKECPVQLLDVSRFETPHFECIHQILIQLGEKAQLNKNLRCLFGTLFSSESWHLNLTQHIGCCSRIILCLIYHQLLWNVILLDIQSKNLTTFYVFLAPLHSLCQCFTYFSIYVIIPKIHCYYSWFK